MTYKQIETSREIRQWIGLATSAVLAATALDKAYPDLRYRIAGFGKNLKKKTINFVQRGALK